MSVDQFKAFLEKAKADVSLQEKIKSATDSASVIAIAKDEGFMLSLDDIEKAQSEISDADLDSVAGGIPVVGGIKGGVNLFG